MDLVPFVVDRVASDLQLSALCCRRTCWLCSVSCPRGRGILSAKVQGNVHCALALRTYRYDNGIMTTRNCPSSATAFFGPRSTSHLTFGLISWSSNGGIASRGPLFLYRISQAIHHQISVPSMTLHRGGEATGVLSWPDPGFSLSLSTATAPGNQLCPCFHQSQIDLELTSRSIPNNLSELSRCAMLDDAIRPSCFVVSAPSISASATQGETAI